MTSKEGFVEAFPTGVSVVGHPRQRKWYQLSGKDVPSHVPIDNETSSETSSLQDNIVDNHNNIFEAAEAQDIYKMVDGFEGAHRFDPTAKWTAEEEKKLVRRVR